MPHAPDTAFRAYRPEDLLGPLTELQRKNAPETLYVAGDEELLRSTVVHRGLEEGERRG